ALQIAWCVQNLDSLRPIHVGNTAPTFALPTIEAGGAPGARRGLAPGKITVLDFWATWCKPCLAAMPKLDKLARDNPDIDVIAVNLDDTTAARALFDRAGYVITLLGDDDDVSTRYSVTAIPHTVVIDREGTVRKVFRGDTGNIAAAVESVRK
ncbi:MAG TPA: TlpA disulfide reductase family protein, partial [Kofleriaceae bacterium]|nr:TlpA disulfide reductase family protein [Kofleriaceae bacterium]